MSVSVKPTTLGKARVDSKDALQTADSKWVGLKAYAWTDQDGKQRKWEVAHRKTTAKSGVDAVAIAAILKHPSKPPTIPIILQYRPPIENFCVELPAGLIDGNEAPEEAAKRELHEETGYGGKQFEGRVKVVELGGILPSDPGMTTANMHLCTLEVELKEDEAVPESQLDEGEHIEVRLTPVSELYAHLQAYEKLGYSVDARLHHYAAGIEIAKRLGISA